MAKPAGPINTGITPTGALTHTLTWENTGVYSGVDVYRNQDGGAFSLIDSIGGEEESYADTVSTNIIYGYKVCAQLALGGEETEFSPIVYTAHWSDTKTRIISVHTSKSTRVDRDFEDETIINVVVEPVIEEGGDFVETWTTTISVTTIEESVETTFEDYAYYLGTTAGQVCEYSAANLSDNGVSIDASWRSKSVASFDIDPRLFSNWLSLYKVQITYVDLSANTPIIVSVSTDGGVSWESSPTEEVGTGDAMVKDVFFYFVKTGAMFDFKIQSPSSNKKFQIVRMLGFFLPRGEVFSVS